MRHISILFLLIGTVLAVAPDEPSVIASSTRGARIDLEATLIAASEHPGIACGRVYVHQVARYRVDRVVSGSYAQPEIVVDHPACDGDVFKAIPIGSRVHLALRVLRSYGAVTCWPGIRERSEKVNRFFVAQRAPQLVGSAALRDPQTMAAQLAHAAERAQRGFVCYP